MTEQKPISLDGIGFDVLREAVLELLNQYPGLDGRYIVYASLDKDGGISMEPENGALVYSERTDIIGGVVQECQFPFFVVYRIAATNENQKLNISEFLDTLGAWLCKEPVTIDRTAYQLNNYPELTGGRKITSVTRFNSYALDPNENGTQDWVLPVTVKYNHEFVR